MTVAVSHELTQRQWQDLRAIAADRAGIDIDRSLPAQFGPRLAPRLAALGIESFDLYLRFLTCGPHQGSEFQELLGALAGPGGGCFDDGAQFDAFERWAIPRILDARSRARRIRVWSAGCGEGCETYTIAMLIERALGRKASHWRIEVLGTDLRDAAVTEARSGCYALHRLEAVPDDLRRMHIREERGTGRLGPELLEATRFERHNLLDRAGARHYGIWDAIFCRGVLGGMHAAASQRTLTLLVEQLAPEGFLFVGRGETIPGIDELVRRIPLPCAGYQKRADALPSPAKTPEARP